MSFDGGHGTQVEYVGSNGRTFLWYPGNKVVLPGRWKLQGKTVCFLYGPNTYNPVTGVVGAQWECEPIAGYIGVQTERAAGDVFGLAQRTEVPFILQRARTTIAALASEAGMPQPATQKAELPQSAAPGMSPSASPAAQCAAIIAQAHSSRMAMAIAASTYFYGVWMGHPCVAVDYSKAFALLSEAGDTATINGLTAVLKERAATGNPKAISTLRKLGVAGY